MARKKEPVERRYLSIDLEKLNHDISHLICLKCCAVQDIMTRKTMVGMVNEMVNDAFHEAYLMQENPEFTYEYFDNEHYREARGYFKGPALEEMEPIVFYPKGEVENE